LVSVRKVPFSAPGSGSAQAPAARVFPVASSFAASYAMAEGEADATRLRSTIMSRILTEPGPTLSADQQTILQKVRSKIGTNINAAIDARFARLDKWIARHSK